LTDDDKEFLIDVQQFHNCTTTHHSTTVATSSDSNSTTYQWQFYRVGLFTNGRRSAERK